MTTTTTMKAFIAFMAALASMAPLQAMAVSVADTYNHSDMQHWDRSPGQTITYRYHSTGTGDITGTDEFIALRNSFQTWENDAGSYIDFVDGGTTTNAASLIETGTTDGVNVIRWLNTYPGEVDADLAVTARSPISGNPLVEMDTVFDETDTWCNCISSPPTNFDVETVMLHEAGHWLRLQHATQTDLVMTAAYQGNRRTLQYGDIAGVRYIYTNMYGAGTSIGDETQGADLANGLVNSGSTRDYVFAWADNPSGANTIKYSFGWDISSSTGAASSWSTPASISSVGDETQGVGVALAQINNDANGRPDLVIAWIDNPFGANTVKYRIGWDVSTAGVPASWSTDKTMPSSDVGSESQGLGIAIADTPDTGTVPELFVFWVDNPSGANTVYYKVGWNINTSGDAASWSTRFTPGIAPGDETQGLGVSIGNWIGTSNPDVIVFWIDNPTGNNHGYYRVGQDISSTGSATWTAARDTFPNDWRFVGTETQGAGATLLDVNSDGRLDVSFAWVDNPFGANTGDLRTEWAARMGTDSHG